MKRLLLALMLAASCATPRPPTRGERAEKKARAAEQALNDAEGFLEAAQPAAAEAPLAKARALLAEPIIEAYPDRFFLKERLEKAEQAKTVITVELQKKEAQANADRQREQVQDILRRLREAVDRLKKTGAEVTKFEYEEAERLQGELEGALKAGVELEPKFEGYKKAAQRARKVQRRLFRETRSAGQVMAFREGPVKAQQEGQDLMKKARATRNKSERRALYLQARRRFLTCKTEGGAMIDSSAMLKKVRFFVGARKTSPRAIVKSCRRQASSAKRKLGR